MIQSLLWQHADDGGAVTCALCAHRCRVAPGGCGICKVRINSGGTLYSRAYGGIVAGNIDPVEKKPLYHFLPSSATYSIAAAGCNFRCDFCQNWSISQIPQQTSKTGDTDTVRRSAPATPRQIVDQALKHQCESISFTYTEPTVFFEYALDTAKLAAGEGLKTIFVSNGYMTPECLEEARPYLDACNIDLKSFREDFYKNRCGASLAPVLNSLRAIRAMGIWLEVTTLVIAGENDSDAELADAAAFIAGELGADTPWHLSRFFPQYRMVGKSATEISAVERAVEIGKRAGLRYVYAGNTDFGRDTLCPSCNETIIRRNGYMADISGLDTGSGSCIRCDTEICGVFV